MFDPWATEARPAVSRVLRSSGDNDAGMVVPITNPCTDLEEAPGGIQLKGVAMCPQYVTFPCKITEAAQVEATGVGDLVDMTFSNVQCLLSGEDAPTIEVEYTCPTDMAEQINEEPANSTYLVLASVSQVTEDTSSVLALQIWRLPDGNSVDPFKKETALCSALLEGKVEDTVKRKAKDLMESTPSKVRVVSGPMTSP